MEFSLRQQLTEKGLVAKFCLDDLIGSSPALEIEEGGFNRF